MASSSSSPRSLGWYRVIETLADSKLELPLLKELVNRVPNFYTAAPESARERVALRYLEECASRGIVGTKDKSGGTDASQSTVEFLCQNLPEHIDPSELFQSRIVPISDDIRQFISQKRSTLPKPSLDLLKNSALEGSDVKQPSTREDGCSSSHRQEENTVEEEQDVIGSPRSACGAESLHNGTSQNLPSQNADDANKTANESLHENIPTTAIDGSYMEAAETEPSSDDVNQFILKRRAAAPETCVEELKEPIPSASILTKPSTYENNENLRSNANPKEPIPETSIPTKPSTYENNENLRSNANPKEPIPETSIPTKHSTYENNENLRSNANPKEPIPETSIPTKPSSYENNENLRSNANPKEPIPDTSIPTKPSTYENNENLRSNANPKEPIPEMSIPTKPSTYENNENLRSNANQLDDLNDCESNFIDSQIPFAKQNQCFVCNKGGQLFTCSREGCGISVHVNCIMTTPSNFGKENQFYCPCCACTRAAHAFDEAKKVFSLAKESLSSFLEMEKNQNQENSQKEKQPVKKNMNGKRKSKRTEFSDGDTSENGDGDATLAGFSGDASSSWESASRDSRRRVEKNGRMKKRRVQCNDENVSDDRDMLLRRGEEAKRRETRLAFEQLDKYRNCKSGPGATSGSHAVPRGEEIGNEKRKEDRVDANVNWKRKAAPRYSNKVVAPRRRNMLPWTEEEEQALREGMQKFGVTPDGRIPWCTILEYRRNVFHRTRLPNDLKDKWRNMMKKGPIT